MGLIKIDITNEMEKFDQYYNSDLSAVYKKNRELIFSIVSVFSDIQKKLHVNDNDLIVIEQGLSHNWQVVFYYCAGMYLAEFAPHYPNLYELIEKISKSKKYQIRRNAIILTDILKNDTLKNQIIHNGLTDKSLVCRELALEKLFDISVERANDEILKIKFSEKDAKLQKRLVEISEIITKGFTVQDMDNYVIIKYRKQAIGMDKKEFKLLSEKDIIKKGME